MENVNYVKCPICKKKLKYISTKHLRAHSINSTEEFKERFPISLIYCEEFKIQKNKLDALYREENKEKLDNYFKNYRKKQSKKRNEYQKKYKINNLELVRKKDREYAKKNKNKKREYDKDYRKNNREKINENSRKYRKEHPYRKAWSDLLYCTLKKMGQQKKYHTIKELGYSPLELKNHIESLFTEDMKWENYGEWHIDHVLPIVSFAKNTPPSIVNSLNNLQPLWSTSRIINNQFYLGNLNKNKY